jgi:D-mannonate dehydratase
MKELSAVLAECAARTEIARVGVEEARKKQEAATAKQEELTAMLEERWAEADARWQEERVVMHREAERREKAMEESSLETRAIIAELKEHRDERRALIEAIFRVIDRLDRQQPPPPPDLRSV